MAKDVKRRTVAVRLDDASFDGMDYLINERLFDSYSQIIRRALNDFVEKEKERHRIVA